METSLPFTAVPEKPTASRLVLIDVLRGFALLGIIINHIASGYLAGPPPNGVPFNVFSPADAVVNTAVFYLTTGKFFTIFSFLFGLSFAMQIDRSSNKGAFLSLRFVWRLLLLLAIGFVHTLFFSGDILVIYAVVGLVLIPARWLPDQVLLPLALLLLLNTPAILQQIHQLSAPAPTRAQLEVQKKSLQNFWHLAQAQYRIKQSGSVGELVAMNATEGLTSKLRFQLRTGRLWITGGLFLLGLYAGRKKLFEYSPQRVRFFRKLLLGSAILAALSTTLAVWFARPLSAPLTGLGVLGNGAFSLHQASLSAFYVAGLVLLYWQSKATLPLNRLAPVGQMGLTSYLLQSVFGVWLFYGIGLGMLGKLGVAACVAIGVGFFACQLLLAAYWMSRFRYGLAEWLWRSLTYGKVQPFRKAVHKPVAAA